MPVLLSGNDQS